MHIFVCGDVMHTCNSKAEKGMHDDASDERTVDDVTFVIIMI